MPDRIREWSAYELPCSWALVLSVTFHDHTDYALRMCWVEAGSGSRFWRQAGVLK